MKKTSTRLLYSDRDMSVLSQSQPMGKLDIPKLEDSSKPKSEPEVKFISELQKPSQSQPMEKLDVMNIKDNSRAKSPMEVKFIKELEQPSQDLQIDELDTSSLDDSIRPKSGLEKFFREVQEQNRKRERSRSAEEGMQNQEGQNQDQKQNQLLVDHPNERYHERDEKPHKVRVDDPNEHHHRREAKAEKPRVDDLIEHYPRNEMIHKPHVESDADSKSTVSGEYTVSHPSLNTAMIETDSGESTEFRDDGHMRKGRRDEVYPKELTEGLEPNEPKHQHDAHDPGEIQDQESRVT